MLRSSEAALAAALRHTARPSQFTSPDEPDPMKNDLDRAALEYHRLPKPGKLEITPTKPPGTQRDLALAYSPGVAAARSEARRVGNNGVSTCNFRCDAYN